MATMNPINSKTQKGQSIAFFALLLPLMAVFLLGILDYMVTSSRVMQGMALADLAAHAGVQEIKVQPNGSIIPDPAAATFATEYFGYAAPKYVALDSVWCGMKSGLPACAVEAGVESAGILIPKRMIKVTSLAYMVYGVTREKQ